MKIKVISFDTRAIIPTNYRVLSETEDRYQVIRTHNELLLVNLLKDEHSYDQHIVLIPDTEVISDSQAPKIASDFATCYQSGLQEPKKCIQVEYEPINSDFHNIERVKRCLYEQMHQLAKKYPESDLTFELCYGSAKNKELFSYFKETLRLVPDNIIIKNPLKEEHKPYRGRGLINPSIKKHQYTEDLILLIGERERLPHHLDEKLKSFENLLQRISDEKLKYITRSIAMIAQEKCVDLADNPQFNKFLDNALNMINLQATAQQRVHFNILLEQSMLIFKLVGFGTKRQRFFNDEERIVHLNWLLYVNQLLEGTLSCFEQGDLTKMDQIHHALAKLSHYKNHQYLVTACAFILGGLLTLTPAISVILLNLVYGSALLAICSLVVGVPVYFAGLVTLSHSSAAFEIARGQSDQIASLKEVVDYFDEGMEQFEMNRFAVV